VVSLSRRASRWIPKLDVVEQNLQAPKSEVLAPVRADLR
jgi:hypothetical protein